MARVFKRAGRSHYLIDFKDTAGVTRRATGFTDKGASETLARMIDRAVAIRQSGDVLAGDMLRWLDTLKPTVRDSLAKWNVIDPQRAAAGKGIKAHVEEWAAILEAKGDCRDYVKTSIARIIRLIAGCGWRNAGLPIGARARVCP